MTGIGYDPTKVGGEINSIDELLTNPKLKGKVTMLTEFGDTMGLVMLANGDDPSKVTNASFDRAVKKIKKAVDSGQIRQFTGNDYAPLLAKGDVWACCGLVGRHGAAAGRPSGPEVDPAEGRRDRSGPTTC